MSNKEMTTEKRLKVRLYLSLLVYTVVGVLMLIPLKKNVPKMVILLIL